MGHTRKEEGFIQVFMNVIYYYHLEHLKFEIDKIDINVTEYRNFTIFKIFHI